MIDKLKELKDKKKLLYYVALPLLGILLLVKFLMEMNVKGAVKDVKKAEKADAQLQDEQKEAEVKAQIYKEEADKAEDEIAIMRDKVDEDWNK